MKGYFFKKKLKYFLNKLLKQLFTYFQIQIKPSITTYICTSCLHNINRNQPHVYEMLNKISQRKIILLIERLTHLKFSIIHKLYL
jgi:hypothetical protein